jgi:hypothetical protein
MRIIHKREHGDVKNLFVGMGGMGNLPGLPAVAGGYGGGFSNNDVGIVISIITHLGGLEDGVRIVRPDG